MSIDDTTTAAPDPNTTAAPAPNTTAAPTAPQTPADYERLYRQEVAERINERNLYRPAQQLMNQLDEGSRAAIMELADLARSGDPDAIAEWNLRTIQQVTGKDAATLIAERQVAAGQTGAAPTQPAPSGLSAQEVAELVANEIAKSQTAQRGQAQVAAEMAKSGYQLESAAGRVIIAHAVDNNATLADAIAWFENDMATTAMERARAAAAAGASIPGTSPAGTPVATTPDGKAAGESDEDFRRRSILAKLTAGPTN